MNDGVVLLMLAVGGVLFLVVVMAMRGGGSGKGGPRWQPGFGTEGTEVRPFEPTVSGPGIAIDADHGWLWLATVGHGCLLLDRAEVRAWSHEYTRMPNGQMWNNELVFRLSDLHRPVVKVGFGRNYRLAEEWQARLTSWLNG